MIKIFGKSIILCLSVFITLIIGEIIIRYLNIAPVIFNYKIFEPMTFVANPKICYKMKPFGICEGGYLNSEGFKDTEFNRNKDNNLVRIILLGDSITKGTGVKLGETFSDQLEIMLNQESNQIVSEINYEVMNFGVGGYNIVSEIEILKDYGLKYHPNIVILNYFFNDNEDYSFNYFWFINRPDISPNEKNLVYQYYLESNRFKLIRLLLRSHLFTFCYVNIGKIIKMRKEIEYPNLGVYKTDVVSEKILELKKLSEKHNFIPLIFMHPILDYDINPPHENYKLTQNSAKKLDILCFDLGIVYQNESTDPKVFLKNYNDNIHPNVKGHNLIARYIFTTLKQMNLL